jgi:hypothetical protein
MDTLLNQFTPNILLGNDDDELSFHQNFPRMSHARTIGAAGNDISNGQLVWDSKSEMPIVRKVVMFDTRFRDPAITPTAQSVRFKLDQPMYSVSRISVMSIRLPIVLNPINVGLTADDYAMMSIGINLHDTNIPVNQPDGGNSRSTFNRALAYIPLVPSYAGSTFAEVTDRRPPGAFYSDFIKPIGSIQVIELSWWRFQKTVTGFEEYNIPVAAPGTIGTAAENIYVEMAFYCRNRKP